MNIEGEINLLRKIRECLIEAGLYDRTILGFGTLLGAIRPTKREDLRYHLGFITWDHDADLILLYTDPEEREKYFEICKKRKLFEWPNPSGRIQRKPNGEIIWFSLKDKKKMVRCCNWFGITYKGIQWHSKGKKWTVNEKFDFKRYNYNQDYDAICKGVPDKYFANLMEINFEGMKFNVPVMSGSLLDLWYPGWAVPRKGGASKKDTVMLIKRWDDLKTWRIQ